MRSRKINRIGDRYGKLTVIGEASPTSSGLRRVLCRCDCGVEKAVNLGTMRNGYIQSCGCIRKTPEWLEKVAAGQITHGENIGRRVTPEYQCWLGVKARCLKENAPNYRWYGGAGVKIHPGWVNDFAAFLAHVGRRPSPKHSIDRIDPFGHYEPGNVRWVTSDVQARNKRKNANNRQAVTANV